MYISTGRFLIIFLISSFPLSCLSHEENTHRFSLKNSAVVLDSKLNLLWARCSLGQVATVSKCEGIATIVDPAKGMSREFSYNGEKGWRLPTPQELSSLVMCSSGLRSELDQGGEGGTCEGEVTAPTINTEIFPGTPINAAFWSNGGCGGYAIATNFKNGSSYCYTLNDGPQYVRLVRNL